MDSLSPLDYSHNSLISQLDTEITESDYPTNPLWSHGLWCFGAYQGGSGVKGKTKKDLFWDKFFQGFQSAVAAVSDLRGQVTPR
tara:strand:- start:1005 stop:1256 length:252 start_codon:yes stop_codon:yes gene_type:complete